MLPTALQTVKLFGYETEIKYKRHRTTLIHSINNQQLFYLTSIPNVFEEPILQEFSAGVTLSYQKKCAF